MKRIVIVPLLVLSLGGCAELQSIGTGVSLLTKSVTNPVTTNDLYAIESSINTAVKLLNTYRAACIAGTADVNCKANIRKIQAYTKEVPIYLIQLRTFVKQNDQINATLVYNNLVTLYTNAKKTAGDLGVNLGS